MVERRLGVRTGRYRFGSCILDLQRRELLCKGKVVDLQLRSFDLLAHIVSHAPKALSKEELISAVWPTVHVTDGVLTSAITKIRRAIQDPDGAGRMLRTLHGIGYRFDAKVESADCSADEVRDVATGASVSIPEPLGSMDGAEDFEAEQLVRARRLALDGQAAAALYLLDHSRANLCFEDALLRVRLRRQRLLLADARLALSELLAEFDLSAHVETKAQLLLESAHLYDSESQIDAALHCCEKALELVGMCDNSPALLADVLAMRTRCHYLLGFFTEMSTTSDKLIELAQSTQSRGLSIEGHLSRGRALRRLGDLDAARQDTLKALALATVEGSVEEKADVYYELAYMYMTEWDYPLSIECARRACELTTDFGDLRRRDRARTRLVMGFVHLSELDTAAELLSRYESEASVAALGMAEYNFSFVRAFLLWRQGEAVQAIQMMQDLEARWIMVWPGLCRDLRLEYVDWSMALGDSEPSRQLLAQQDRGLTVYVLAKLRAGLALAEGNREVAKRELRNAWLINKCNSVGAWHIPVSLAFLQIEDRELSGYEALLVFVQKMPRSEPMLALLLYAHEIVFCSAVLDMHRWCSLVRPNCGLVYRHRWMLDEESVRAWLAGERQLTALYSLACF
ncbi:MAG: hypothetical protein CFE43_21300 [Burkholderiales bacterium PBB3]|nr:MAG: hypothetical protein CFE43_21300 [Burkholderiales bacterium PBB3]